MHARRSRSTLGCLVCALVCAVSAPPATAATNLGETFAPTDLCQTGRTFLQTASPLNAYTVPFRGVITQWRTQGTPATGLSVRFKAARHIAEGNYTVVGRSPVHAVAPNVLNAFADRVPVQAGDVIGYWINAYVNCFRVASGFESASASGDTLPGPPASYTPSSGGQFNLAATVERDADGDGFGDETQDGCPKDPTTHGPCVVPDTRITARPRDVTSRALVIYEFSANVPQATFECSFDGPYRPCTSPRIYRRVHPGRHRFLVRATDRFGAVEQTPAADRFRLKRKKHRR
jgi:hypothetical protein